MEEERKLYSFLALLFYCNFTVYGLDVCRPSVTFSCTHRDPNGFCSNTTDNVGFSYSWNSTYEKNGFIPKTIRLAKFLQPIEDACSTGCCADPCAGMPCRNGGTCSNETDSDNKSFKCTCKPDYKGEWCQVAIICGGKTCHDKAYCSNETECVCPYGFRGDGTYCTKYCSKKIVTGHKCTTNSTFNSTVEDATQYSEEKCSDGRSISSIKCTTDQNRITDFADSTFTCLSCDTNLDSLFGKENKNDLDAKAVENKLEQVRILTKSTNKSEEVVKGVVEFLGKLIHVLITPPNKTGEYKMITKRAMEDVMLTIENLREAITVGDVISDDQKDNLEPKPNESETDKSKRSFTREVYRIVDTFARSLNLSGKTELTIQTKTMSLKVVKPASGKIMQGISFVPVIYVSENENITKRTILTMDIPLNTVDRMAKLTEQYGKELKLVFILHQDASLLTGDMRTGQVLQATYTEDGGTSIGKLDDAKFTIEFKDPKLPSDKQNSSIDGTILKIVTKHVCVFWDFRHEEWATEGCDFNEEATGVYQCVCNHFTSFALLLRVGKDNQLYDLDWYSLVTSGMSVICLLVTIIIYVAVKELRSRRPTPILINICVNLMIGFLIFLVGMDGRSKKFSEIGCYVSAVLMHLSFLFSWFWMLIYSLNIYYALVKVVSRSPLVGRKTFMYVFGYGTPIAIVAADLTVSLVLDKNINPVKDPDFDKKHYISSYICWIRNYSMYVGFAGPIALILLINIVLFVVIIRKLTWKRKQIQSTKQKASVSQQFIMAVTVLSMMGLTWIFGYIMLVVQTKSVQDVFATLFNIFNCCQGVVIFFVSCVRQKAVRVMWMIPIQKFFGCYEHKKPRGSKSFSSSDTGVSSFTTLPRTSKSVASTTML